MPKDDPQGAINSTQQPNTNLANPSQLPNVIKVSHDANGNSSLEEQDYRYIHMEKIAENNARLQHTENMQKLQNEAQEEKNRHDEEMAKNDLAKTNLENQQELEKLRLEITKGVAIGATVVGVPALAGLAYKIFKDIQAAKAIELERERVKLQNEQLRQLSSVITALEQEFTQLSQKADRDGLDNLSKQMQKMVAEMDNLGPELRVLQLRLSNLKLQVDQALQRPAKVILPGFTVHTGQTAAAEPVQQAVPVAEPANPVSNSALEQAIAAPIVLNAVTLQVNSSAAVPSQHVAADTTVIPTTTHQQQNHVEQFEVSQDMPTSNSNINISALTEDLGLQSLRNLARGLRPT